MKKLLLLMLVLVFSFSFIVVAGAKKVEFMRGHHVTIEDMPQGKGPNTTILAKEIEKIIGHDIEWITLPRNNAQQKRILTLASGDVPDLMVIPGKSEFYKYAAQGLFKPVNQYLDKIPNYTKITDKKLMKATQMNGEYYGFVTSINWTMYLDYALAARKDTFDLLGIENPNTLDEFYQALKVLKNETEMIPFTIEAAETGAFLFNSSIIAGAFGCANPTMKKNNELVFSYIQPEWKQFLTFMKKLYDEGLLDKEFAVNKSGKNKEKFSGGQAATTLLAFWDLTRINDSFKNKGQDFKGFYLKPPVGLDGKRGFRAKNPIHNFFAIPVQANNTEDAVEVLDWFFTEEKCIMGSFGIEGIHYNMKNGERVLTEKYEEDKMWFQYYNDIGKKSADIRYQRIINKGMGNTFNQLREMQDLLITEEPTHLAPPIPEFDNNIDILQEYVYENSVKFIMGARPLSEFDQYITGFNERGGSEAIEAVNEWFKNL